MTTIRVRVTPGAREDAVVGWVGDPLRLRSGQASPGSGQAVLRVRVRAPPERGRANQAVCDLLARALGVARSAVTVERGHGSRDKVLAVEGLSEEDLRRRLGGI